MGLSKYLCVGEELSCSSSSFDILWSLLSLMYAGVRGLSRIESVPLTYVKACLSFDK